MEYPNYKLKSRKLTFWEQPIWRWNAMFDEGVCAAYTSSAFAARLMTKKKSGKMQGAAQEAPEYGVRDLTAINLDH